MRKLVSVTLTLGTLISSSIAVADCPEDCINIGSFNIKMFGNGNFPANKNSEINDLVDRIAKKAELDVVVLQEINIHSDAWTKKLLPKLENNNYRLTGTGTFGGTSADRQQYLVMLHRVDKIWELEQVSEVVDVTTYDDGNGCKYNGIRSPITARFASKMGGFDFRVYGVHLKSNRPVSGSDELCDNRIRSHQISEVANSINHEINNSSERDFIVTGDFNTEFSNDELQSLRDLGMTTVHTEKCKKDTLENCSHVHNSKRYRGLIDYVVIGAGTNELMPSSGMVMRVDNVSSYNRNQSDHVPVWASFSIASKDDD